MSIATVSETIEAQADTLIDDPILAGRLIVRSDRRTGEPQLLVRAWCVGCSRSHEHPWPYPFTWGASICRAANCLGAKKGGKSPYRDSGYRLRLTRQDRAADETTLARFEADLRAWRAREEAEAGEGSELLN